MAIKDAQLRATIEALQAELENIWVAAKPGLMKAEGDKPDTDGPSDDGAADSASAPVDSAATPTPDAPLDGAGSASAAPDSAAPDGASDPAAQQSPVTVEALQAEYAQLPPEELDMHLQAAMAAKQALAGAAGGPPGAPAPAAPMGPPPGASASPASPAAPSAGPESQVLPPDGMAQKAEIATHAQANGGKMGKSEIDTLRTALAKTQELIEKQNAVMKSQAEDVENLTKSIELVLTRPERKAVTNMAFLSKSEVETSTKSAKTFTPESARAALAEMIPTLSKAERQVVLKFYNGEVKADALAPILEKFNK
jgi:hypothetical protein